MLKNKSRPLALLTAGLLLAGLIQAQEAVNAAGGDATGSGGTVAFSVGQVVYTTNVGSNGSVAQGVQQTYDITNIGIKETNLSISLTVFPNPTTDNLTLQISDYNNEKLSYQLTDMLGKLLTEEQIGSKQTIVCTKDLPVATYFVNILNTENKIVQSFKIIKTL